MASRQHFPALFSCGMLSVCFTPFDRTPRRNMLDVCGQCNVSKKVGVIPERSWGCLPPFLGMGCRRCAAGKQARRSFSLSDMLS